MAQVNHEFLREGVEARAYQLRSLQRILSFSTLMVMPTGFGKTAVQWMAMAEFLRRGSTKIVLVAPTTGLVDQQVRMARERIRLEPERILAYTGETPPEKRRERWEAATLVMATPQVIRNDAMNGIIDLSEVDLLILDEAHHATGNHAYAQVGSLYHRARPEGRVLAATASPGSNARTVTEVQRNLNVNNLDLSKRGEALMAPYDVDMEIHLHRLDLPETLTTLLEPLKAHFEAEVDHLQRLGFLAPKEHIGTRDIEKAQLSASRAIQQRDVRGYDAARRIADLRRVHILTNLLQTQGTSVARAFLDRAEEEGRTGRKTNRLLSLPVIHSLRLALKDLNELHPKQGIVARLAQEEIDNKPDGKILIFTEFRDSVQQLVALLSPLEGIRPDEFIGQSSRGSQKGMTQKEQLAQLDRFRSGEINVLVATSVGEEGLDVPSADLVLLYEPVPSAVRAIQRRGRTARQRAGSVHMLITNNTRDAYVQRASEQQEANMHRLLARMVKQKTFLESYTVNSDALDAFHISEGDDIQPAAKYLSEALTDAGPPPEEENATPTLQRKPASRSDRTAPPLTAEQRRPQEQRGLFDFDQGSSQPGPNKPSLSQISRVVLNAAEQEIESLGLQGDNKTIAIDHREGKSTLPGHLKSLGFNVTLTHLPSGDVRLSERILIERKTARDLLASIKNGRLLDQCRSLQASAARPLLLIETGGDSSYGLHPNAVLGALAHVTLDLGLPVMMVKDAKEAAHFIAVACKRENDQLERYHASAFAERVDENALDLNLKTAKRELDAIELEPESSHPWLDTAHERLSRCFAYATEPFVEQNPGLGELVRAFSPDLAGLLVASEEDVLTKTGCDVDEARALIEAMKGVKNR
ncbi:MAG: ERCC4 domain-containing protein [Poseidonia sp.]